MAATPEGAAEGLPEPKVQVAVLGSPAAEGAREANEAIDGGAVMSSKRTACAILRTCYPLRAPAILGVLTLVISGCAEYAEFRSSPSPANVYLNDTLIGTTPLDYPIARGQVKNTWNYRIELDGYEPDNGILHRSVAPGRIVAAVFTLCISCAFRGFQYFRPVNAVLTPIGKTSTGQDKGSPAERLRRLDDAFDKGLINEREYRKLRSQILGDF